MREKQKTSLKKTDGRKQFHETQIRLAAIVNSSDDAIIGKTLDGIISSWNPGAEKVFGYSAGEAIGKPMLMIFPPERVNEEVEILARIGRGEKVEHFETVRVRKDGRRINVSVTLSPIADSNGKIIGASKIARDITERKHADERLQLLGSAVEQSKESILITAAQLDLPGPEILFVNPAFTQMTGYSAVEAIGKTPRILQGPKTDKAVLKRLRENLTQGDVFDGETVNYRKDGSEFHMEWQITPIRDAEGIITHFVAIQRDITGRRLAEEELRWKTTFLEAQIDSAPDAILVVNENGKRIFENERLFQLFKIPSDFAHDDNDTKMLQYVTAQMKNPKQFNERVAYLYAHPDMIGRDEIELSNGTILDRYSAPVRDKTGKYYGRIWTFRDITGQRKLEEQFRQSQKMEAVGHLAGGVAHDFNNILAIIQMQSELMKSSGGLSADQAEFADEIGVTVQRAAALTRQLLLFSRREVFQPRDLDLSESITSTAKMLRRILGENIQVQLKLASQPMFLNADAGMMDQILMNLCVNARDAMPNGGQLIIETSGVEFDAFATAQSSQARPGSFVCLSVSDSGCGISPEIVPKIFEPFFTTKDVGKGTGLGLATVFGIVQQHQGWINVYSEVNHGTTFRIYFPRLAKNGGVKSSQSVLTEMRGGNETILLAEDDPSLRVAVRKALAQLGYRILEAPTGVKALEVWKQNRDEIRLLLTDLVMPDGMTGKDLADRLLQENSKLKVIYMSGYSAEVVGKNFPLKEGVNFLTKPFQSAKLAQTIRIALDI